MTPELQRFLDAATKPLEGKIEAREEVRAELMGRVSHQGVPLEMINVSRETEILEEPSARSPWVRRGAMLAGLITCLILWSVGTTMDSLSFVRAMMAQQLSFHYRWGGGIGMNSVQNDFLFGWQERVAPDLPITGNPFKYPEIEDETRELREQFPEDLVVLQEHLSRRANDRDQFMSEAEQSLVERLDPDNALWLVMESEWLLNKAYGRDPGSFSYMATATSTPADPDALKLAWERYEAAGEKSIYADYSPEMLRREIDAFPPDETFMGSMLSMGYVDLIFSAGEGRYGFHSSAVAEDFEKRVSTLVKDKDLDGLKRFSVAWKNLNRMMVEAPFGKEAGRVGTISSEARQIADAFHSLKHLDLSSEFNELATELSNVEMKRYVLSGDPIDDLMPIRGDMEGVIPQQLHADELKPGRLAERAFLDRMLGWGGVFFLLILVLACGFESYRRGLPVKGMARGVMPLFSWEDQAWVAGLGVAAPWAFWWCVTRLTPMGFRDVGMVDEWVGMGWFLQAIIALLFLMVMLVETVRWRWAKRGAFLGFRGRVDWLGWVVAGLLAVGVPAVSLVQDLAGSDEEKGFFLLGMLGLGLVGLLWLLWVAGMNLFTPRHGALRPNLISRSLLPWSIVSTLLMLLSVGVLFQAEKGWYRKDTLFPLSTSESYNNGFEERAMNEIEESLKLVWGVEQVVGDQGRAVLEGGGDVGTRAVD